MHLTDRVLLAFVVAALACDDPPRSSVDAATDGSSEPRDAGTDGGPMDATMDTDASTDMDATTGTDASTDAASGGDASGDGGGSPDAGGGDAAAGGLGWVEVVGGYSVPAATVDASGNVLALAQGSGTFAVGSTSFTLASGEVAIVSFASDGSLRFARSIVASGGNLLPFDVAGDGAGGLVLVGTAIGPIDVGGGVLAGASGDVLLARFDATGAHVWSRRFGGTRPENGITCAVAPDGTVYVGGQYSDIDLGGGALPAAVAPYLYGFVASFDSAGAHRWSRSIPTSGVMALDVRGGALAVAIQSVEEIDLGGGPLAPLGALDAVIAVLDAATGAHQWSVRSGGAATDRPLGIVLDAGGGVAVAGMFEGTATFGGTSITATGMADAFAARLDATGTVLWARDWGTAAHDQASAVALDASGGLFIGGRSSGTIDFGGGPHAGLGGLDAFVLHVDSTGAHLGSDVFGSSFDDTVDGVAFDVAGNALILGGLVSADFDLDGTTWLTMDRPDGFVARLPR